MKAKKKDLEIAYKVKGEGPPLLLIQGLGYGRWAWFRQLPELQRHFKVIAFDNRGVGESSKPDYPYSIQMMAEDAALLLGHLGIKKAHLLGASMGGMIAQELALSCPRLVDKLILACTSCGYSRGIPLSTEALILISHPQGETFQEMFRSILSPDFTRNFWDHYSQIMEQAKEIGRQPPVPLYAWNHQLAAATGFDRCGDLHKIEHRTLVITGEKDVVVPPQNSEILHEIIPRSELITVPDGGHLFFIEQAARFNREVIRFLLG